MLLSLIHILDVYKRQALIFAYLRPEQTILGLILEEDDGDEGTPSGQW